MLKVIVLGGISISQEFITFPVAQNVILFGNKVVVDIIRWDDILKWGGSLIHCEWREGVRHRDRHTQKEGMWRYTGRTPFDDRGRDWTDEATGQGMPALLAMTRSWEEARKDSLLEPSKSKWPCQPHDFWFWASRTKIIHFVVLSPPVWDNLL